MNDDVRSSGPVTRLMREASLLALVMVLGGGEVLANPQGGTVVGGNSNISSNDKTLTVKQQSDRTIIDWRSFSIGTDETTRFLQPSPTSIAVNRVRGVDPSQIMGTLLANGRIVLINPNGILFGPGARVDVAGLIATVHDIDDNDFMSGAKTLRFNYGGNPQGSVVNEGNIAIRDGGLAAFVAPHVRNSGVIEANFGRVALASANGFSVDLYGDGLLSFAPGDTLKQNVGDGTKALVENSGTIKAGKVWLTAKAAESVVNASINVSGIVQATSASERGGVIELEGPGKVSVEPRAELDASGRTGGEVRIKAGSFSGSGKVAARGTQGDGGKVRIETRGDNVLQNMKVDVSGAGKGGEVTLLGRAHRPARRHDHRCPGRRGGRHRACGRRLSGRR